MSNSLIAVFDAIGAAAFLAAACVGAYNYRNSDLERSYWLAFSVTSMLGSIWLALVALEWLSFSGALLDEFSTSLQAVVIGLYAFAVVGIYGAVHDLRRLRRETEKRASVVSILSRVLRHDIRNDMTVVRGRVTDLETGGDAAETIQEKVDDLLETSEKAWKLERTVNTGDRRIEVDVQDLLRAAAREVTDTHPSASIEIECPDDCRVEASPELQTAFTELLENAAEHAGETPEIEVDVTQDCDGVTGEIRDDGSGMPELERQLLEEGVETPLYHSTGIGLWLAHWIVENDGGRLEIEEADGANLVRVELPDEPSEPDTHWKEAFAGSNEFHDRYQSVFEAVEHPLIVVDAEGTVVDVNEAAAETLTSTDTELLGRRLEDAFSELDGSEPVVEAVEAGEPCSGRTELDVDGERSRFYYAVHTDYVPGEVLVALQRFERPKP